MFQIFIISFISFLTKYLESISLYFRYSLRTYVKNEKCNKALSTRPNQSDKSFPSDYGHF